jgi:enoyl-CoA hydratase/carnithine racemase
MTSDVLFQVDDEIAIVTLNRPARANAIDPPTARRLHELVQEIEADGNIRAAVITGAGERVFCGGSDLKWKAEGTGSTVTDWGFAGFVRAPRGKPFVAAVNGKAVGGGFEIVLACELAVAARHAEFALPEVRRGVVAGGGGLVRLVRRIPVPIAYEVAIAGRVLTADQALELGLVNRVVDSAELLGSAVGLARQCALGAPIAIAESMAVIREAEGAADAGLWARSEQASKTAVASADGMEGIRAFVEKRSPVWRNK